MIDYTSNKATASKVEYKDQEGIWCETKQRFDNIKDFRNWCKYYNVKCDKFSGERIKCNLYSIKYNIGKKTHHTKSEFKSISDFKKLMELRGEDLSNYTNIKLKLNEEL